MAQNFIPDSEFTPDPSDMDPQSAAAMPGMKKIVSAAIDDVPSAPGDDSIQPDYNSPIEAIGFAAPKLGMSATEAIANGLSHTDFGKIVGNEVGSVGKNLEEASRLKRGADIGFNIDKTYYHGSTKNIEEFDPNKANAGAKGKIAGFFTEDPKFANDYAFTPKTKGDHNPSVYPVHLKADNTFDYSNSEHLDQVFDKIPAGKMKDILKDNTINGRPMTVRELEQQLEMGNWNYLEHPDVIKAIKSAGFDSMHVKENGTKNIAVFEPSQVRSKFAKFDPTQKKSGKLSYAEGGQVQPPGFIPDDQFRSDTISQPTVDNSQQDQTTTPPGFIPDDQFHSDNEPYETPGQQVLTGLEGAAKGIAGPIAPITEQVLNKQLFNQEPEETNKHMLAREKANPTISKVSEGAALLGSMYFGVGEAGLIAKAGEALTKGIQGATLASKVGSGAAKAAVENMLFQGSDEASKMLMQDPESSSQTAIAHIGLAGLLGGALGGGLELVKAPLGKLGQVMEDFKGRMGEHTTTGDPATALTQELTDHYNNIRQVADDVYGPSGIKEADIEKAMPEMSNKIASSVDVNSQVVDSAIEKMSKDAYRYPPRLTSKIVDDLAQFKKLTAEAQTPTEIFNATQELKQQLQSYAKFDKFIKPTDDAYDFVRESKKLAFDLRNHLEDKVVWGKAAERQQAINKAYTEFQGPLKDFEKKFTEEVDGEKIISPGKVQTYINSVGKASAEIKKSMLANFLTESEKYQKVIGESHANLGIPSPIVHSPLNQAWATINKKTTGAKLADIFINKGLSDAGGKTMGAAIGAAASHGLGISKEIGALIGAHALGPFFSSVLPALAKPLMSLASHPGAFKEVSEYGASVAKGERLLNKGIRNVFEDDKDVIHPSQMPTDKDTAKLDKILNGLRVNANALLDMGGNIGHYLPNHMAPMTAMASNTAQFLNSQRPQTTPDMPLDSHIKAAPYQANDYNRLLKLAQQPLMALDMMKKGTLNHHDVQAIQTMYPQLYGKMVQKLTSEIVNHKDKSKLIPYKTRMGLSLFVGQPLDTTMTQPSIMATQIGKSSAQSSQSVSQPQKPPSGSSTKELTKAPAANRTPSQARQYNQQTKD